MDLSFIKRKSLWKWMLLVILLIGLFCISPRTNFFTKIQIGQAQSDNQLSSIGNLILDYRKSHDGKSPKKLSELATIDTSPKPDQRPIDGYVPNPSVDYLLPSNPNSSILVFEKSGLWSDGSVAACFDDLTVKRFTPTEFDTLNK